MSLEAVFQKIEEVIKRDLTPSEKDCFQNDFGDKLTQIAQGLMTSVNIQRLHFKVSSKIKTKTSMRLKGKYIFDGLVPGASGQGNSTFQFAVHATSLCCAKIGKPYRILREISVGTQIHEGQVCPTVMPVIDSVQVDDERMAMITPYYPSDVSSLELCNSMEAATNIAMCGLASVKAFSSKKMCHADIKPSNMMLEGAGGKTVVMVDFGSSVPYGESITELSFAFGLDCPPQGSLEYDMTCLAVSIVHTITSLNDPLREEVTRAGLSRAIGNPKNIPLKIAKDCLKVGKDIDEIWEEAKKLIESQFGVAEWLVDLEYIWPRMTT
jgi:serine/threonine protein kinase